MSRRTVSTLALIALAVLFVGSRPLLRAQAPAAAALAGRVTSMEEGAMEGVYVSAKMTGSTITVSVMSDGQGAYAFPRARLAPGTYAVTIRAVGYELDPPGAVTVAADKPAQLDLKLHKTQDLSVQLSTGEWLMSFPGTDQQKRNLLNCAMCHTLERVARSRYTAEQWPRILGRMSNYAMTTTPLRPQVRPQRPQDGARAADEVTISVPTQRESEYLSSLNLSAVTRWSYPLKTLPRPTGKSTHVIITEYDLPRFDAMPHDVVVDPSDGMLWFPDFGHHYLAKFDPKTAKVTEYQIPLSIPTAPTGSLVMGFDRDGNIWFAQMFQSGVGRFDKKTEQFSLFPLPKELYGYSNNAMVSPQSMHVDGKVWMNDVGLRGVRRVDPKTGAYETFEPYKNLNDGEPHSMYGIAADSQNNLYLMDLGNRYITRIDARTGKVAMFPSPTPNSGPRRGRFDAEDRLWFAEFYANKVAMFDARSHDFKEWPMPAPYTSPYDAVIDRAGYIWTGGMSNDHVVRVNSTTGETFDYLLPRTTNIRRVDVDNSTSPPTLWIGNNHGAAIVKVEPQD
jgi:streptogramin lyase